MVNNFYLIGMLLRISPSRVLLSFTSGVVDFAAWAFYSVVFMKYLFGAADLTRTFPEVMRFIVLTMLLMLVISIFTAWFKTRYTPITDQKIHYQMNRKLFDKATSVDISCYENPKFYDSYTKVSTEVFTRSISVLTNIPRLLGALLAAGYVVYSIGSFVNIVGI